MDRSIVAVAQWGLLLPAAFVALAVVRRRRWFSDVLEGAIGGLFTVLVVKIAGTLHYERRPFVVRHLQPLLPHAADNAFPSDHLAAAGLAVAYLWPRSKPLAIAAAAAAAALGVARVLARLHWPGDVEAGFAIGLFAGAAGGAIFAAVRRLYSAPPIGYS